MTTLKDKTENGVLQWMKDNQGWGDLLYVPTDLAARLLKARLICVMADPEKRDGHNIRLTPRGYRHLEGRDNR